LKIQQIKIDSAELMDMINKSKNNLFEKHEIESMYVNEKKNILTISLKESD